MLLCVVILWIASVWWSDGWAGFDCGWGGWFELVYAC